MSTREELEREVLRAAKAWFQAQPRSGIATVFDVTQTALVKAIVELDNAPEPTVYEDRDGDTWRLQDDGHWCCLDENETCDPDYSCQYRDMPDVLEYARREYGPLRARYPRIH